jgi:hypothetical protein
MPSALSSFKKMHEVSHSISDLFSETTPELGNALFGFSSSDLAPNAQAEAQATGYRVTHGKKPTLWPVASSAMSGGAYA